MSNGQIFNFISNTRGVPAHLLHGAGSSIALERPVDVKVGPDGAVYVLDMGPMRVENGQEKIPAHCGRILRCGPPYIPAHATRDQRAGHDAGRSILPTVSQCRN